MSLLEESLRPGQTPLHNMGYEEGAEPLMANMGYDEGNPPPTTPGGLSEKAATPWNDDYDFPVSVGPVSVLLVLVLLTIQCCLCFNWNIYS